MSEKKLPRLVDLDEIAAEIDEVAFRIKLGGKIIAVPNMGLLPSETIEQFSNLMESAQTNEALKLVLPAEDYKHCAKHLNFVQTIHLAKELGKTVQHLVGNPGEDTGSNI